MRRLYLTRALAHLLISIVAAGAGFGPPPVAFGEEAGAAPTPWWQSISLNGLASGSYGYNFNRPPSRTNGLRVFDADDNTFKIDVIELAVQRPTPNPGDAGFRLDLTAGGSIPHVAAAAGLFRDADGKAGDIDMHQAYVSYLARVGRGLRLDLGKFITPMGYEVIDGYDGYNDNATRSILFGYAIPFTHTGVRASYPLGDRVSGTLYLVNGWDNATDNNRDKSMGAQLGVTPCAEFSAYANALYGDERGGEVEHGRLVLDGVATWKPAPRVSIGLNVDYGREQHAAPTDGGPEDAPAATWSGGAFYVRYGLSDRLALIARGETFEDPDGVRTGVAQRLDELTLTPELKVTSSLLLRADLRYDHSDAMVFETDGGLKDHQTTVLVNALVTF